MFRVRIAGHGFAKLVDGSLGRYGFFTNCFISATDASEAGAKAVEQIADRSKLADQREFEEGSSATLEIEEIIEWRDEVPGEHQQGLVWYKES